MLDAGSARARGLAVKSGGCISARIGLGEGIPTDEHGVQCRVDNILRTEPNFLEPNKA